MTSHKSGLWFLFALLVLFLDAAVVYRGFSQFGAHNDWVNHTYEVIGEIEGVVSQTKDLQSAQRGYVLTGEAPYLTPYDLALPDISRRLAALDNLVADNPEQTERLQRLKTEVGLRIATANKIIGTMQRGDAKQAVALVKSGEGKRQMDDIRAIANEMVSEERRLLDARQANADDARQYTERLAAAGLLVAFLILLAVFATMRAEAARRRSGEEALNRALAEMKKVADEDALLSQIGNYMQTSRDVDEVFGILSKVLPKLLPHTSGTIYFFNNSRNLLESGLSWGAAAPGSGSGADFSPDECWGLRQGQMHLMHKGGLEPVCQHIHAAGKGGCACLPLQSHGEMTGLLYVSAEDGAQIEDSRKIVRRAAEQIALAVANIKLQNRLRDQSIRDPLTRLFNRRYLEETMEREFSRARRSGEPVSVLVLDIDHFKKYNDTMGHDGGDALLVEFARLMIAKSRKEDIPCRYGGEEFVMVLPSASTELAVSRANELREEVSRMKVKTGKNSFGSVTVSIGVATFPRHGSKPEEVLTEADTALYAAKHDGRNRVYTPETPAEAGKPQSA